jgi:hypothetical protein
VTRVIPVEHGASVNLYWLPLGAGGHCVRVNGVIYEAASALLGRRPACDLYHSALEVCVPEGRFVLEQTPVPDDGGTARGVVAEGAVGMRSAGRLRIFRYELRCWRDGVIPDIAAAVSSPRLLTRDPSSARRVLDLAPSAPTPVWGRDELGAGEMWNSNSFIAWLVERSGVAAGSLRPPPGGRAPGWHAGLVVARRSRLQPALAAEPDELGDRHRRDQRDHVLVAERPAVLGDAVDVHAVEADDDRCG